MNSSKTLQIPPNVLALKPSSLKADTKAVHIVFLAKKTESKKVTQKLSRLFPKSTLSYEEFQESYVLGKNQSLHIYDVHQDANSFESKSSLQTKKIISTLKKINKTQTYSTFHLYFEDFSSKEIEGILTQVDPAFYQYKEQKITPQVRVYSAGKPVSETILKKARVHGQAKMLAMHLVNTPPNDLHPESYAHFLKTHFQKCKNTKVHVWDEKKIHSEGLELLQAVGNSSNSKPRLVHISYRPLKSKNKKPIALVGKGITFDTGGLDLKPSQAMRLMKKDMGGSASVAGIAHYCIHQELPLKMDFYFALAENAVSENSMRPSDIYTSKKGLSIEIDNTDAEGRLVLADAFTVAQMQKEKPEILIDLATLTGAGKVALGNEIASMFCNDDSLSKKLEKSSFETGDLCWRLPLFKPYLSQLQSPFADLKNSGDGFAGAITAALFLEKFIDDDVSWAHFDIYAWSDAGGSGQGVQLITNYLESRV